MCGPVVEQIGTHVAEATRLYHRLVMVVGPVGSGKTKALRAAAQKAQATLINLNLELSRRMLDLTERQRTLEMPRIVKEILAQPNDLPVFVDNIEVLFDVSLKQDPLRILQSISRNTTLIVSWNGSIDNGHITYASPEHPECRRYPISDFVAIPVSAPA